MSLNIYDEQSQKQQLSWQQQPSNDVRACVHHHLSFNNAASVALRQLGTTHGFIMLKQLQVSNMFSGQTHSFLKHC
jgi:hypothetical protein